MGSKSTVISSRDGSALVPSSVTVTPFTCTWPSRISSSQARRLATPAWARSFCRRSPAAAPARRAAGRRAGVPSLGFGAAFGAGLAPDLDAESVRLGVLPAALVGGPPAVLDDDELRDLLAGRCESNLGIVGEVSGDGDCGHGVLLGWVGR